VFLDAIKDRYYGLGGVEVCCLLNLVDDCSDSDQHPQQGPTQSVDMERLERLADMLIRRGLLCRGAAEDHRDKDLRKDSQRLPAPQIDPPPLATTKPHSPRLLDLANFLLASVRAAGSLRRSSLENIASAVTSARREEGPSALLATLELARVFQGLRRWFFSEKNRCLFNSLALVYFLQRYGYFPYFVIGVQTAPFAAHAWVQRDRIVLDGDPEKVGHFAPILVA
jgi:Transglutaminase-like superfamily